MAARWLGSPSTSSSLWRSWGAQQRQDARTAAKLSRQSVKTYMHTAADGCTFQQSLIWTSTHLAAAVHRAGKAQKLGEPASAHLQRGVLKLQAVKVHAAGDVCIVVQQSDHVPGAEVDIVQEDHLIRSPHRLVGLELCFRQPPLEVPARARHIQALGLTLTLHNQVEPSQNLRQQAAEAAGLRDTGLCLDPALTPL